MIGSILHGIFLKESVKADIAEKNGYSIFKI